MYSSELNYEDPNTKPDFHRRRNRFTSIWIITIGLIGCLIGIIGILLGLIEARRNHLDKNVVQQWQSQCFVFYANSLSHSCEQCDRSICSSYTCYDEKFKVSYTLSNGTELLRTIVITNHSEQSNIQAGEEHPCYYDPSTDDYTTQWNPITTPTSKRTIFFFSIILVAIAAIILIGLFLYLIFVGQIHLRRFRRRKEMLKHLSEDHDDHF